MKAALLLITAVSIAMIVAVGPDAYGANGAKKQKNLPAPKEKAWAMAGRATRHQQIDAWVKATNPVDGSSEQPEYDLPIIPGAHGFGIGTPAGTGRHLDNTALKPGWDKALVGHWTFDKGAPKDAELTGDAAFIKRGNGQALGLKGKGALALPNPKGYLKPGGSFTALAWVRMESPAGTVAGNVDDDGTSWALGRVRHGIKKWAFQAKGRENAVMYPPAPNTGSAWHHLVGTYEGDTGTLRLYLNARQISTVRKDGIKGFAAARSCKLTLGRGLTGVIDDVMLFSAALTDDEIQALYAHGHSEYVGATKTQIIKVTNLNDSGPGSLREAMTTWGPRTIVFEVGGTIHLKSNLSAYPHVTIAGQTAPPPGITLRGAGIRGIPHDCLMQHIRIRVGDEPNPKVGYSERDAAAVQSSNVVFDHCSFSWGADELMQCYGNDITIRNCIFSEGLDCGAHWKGGHSCGLLISDDYYGRMRSNNRRKRGNRIAVIGNLFAHNAKRNPAWHGARGVVINNVVYNYRVAGINVEGSGWKKRACQVSIIGNVYIEGENTFGTSRAIAVRASSRYPENRIYLADNIVGGVTTNDPWSRIKATDNMQDKRPMIDDFKASKPPVAVRGLQIKPSREVTNWVLAHAGARPADRDAVDKRVVNSVRLRTGRIPMSQTEVGGWPALKEAHRELKIPDNPSGDDDGDGYTNLEEWLHGYAAEVERVAPVSDIHVGPLLPAAAAGEGGQVARTLTLANKGGSDLTWSALVQIADNATVGKVKREIVLPGDLSKVWDLAYDGTDLWMSEGPGSQFLYKVDPANGRLRGVLDLHEYAREGMGIAWDNVGKMLWIVDRLGWMIHIVHPRWGDKEYSFNKDGNSRDMSKHNTGVAYGGGAVWAIRSMNSVDCNTIAKLRPVSCQMVDQIVIPPSVFAGKAAKPYAYNVAYLNGGLWIAPYMGGGTIYKLDPRDGTVLRALKGPGGNAQIGIAAGDDNCLWIATQHGDAKRRKAFLVDTGEIPAKGLLSIAPLAGVVPAGKTVKVTVTMNENRLKAGAYSAAVHLHTNDPLEPHFEIPMDVR